MRSRSCARPPPPPSCKLSVPLICAAHINTRYTQTALLAGRADERRPRLLAACHQSATHEHQSDVIGLTDRAPFITLTVNPPSSCKCRRNAFWKSRLFSLCFSHTFSNLLFTFLFFLQGTVHLSVYPLNPSPRAVLFKLRHSGQFKESERSYL